MLANMWVFQKKVVGQGKQFYNSRLPNMLALLPTFTGAVVYSAQMEECLQQMAKAQACFVDDLVREILSSREK